LKFYKQHDLQLISEFM